MRDRSGLRALTQTFRFEATSADTVAHILAHAPLVGRQSIFGQRTVRSTTTEGATRILRGFEPAPVPLLRFDIEMRQHRSDTGIQVVLAFSQPHRKRPYLTGEFVWLLSDAADGTAAILREEINTPAALRIVDRPLHGRRFSLRRFLFFAGGHKMLMKDVVANIRALLH